MNRAEDGARARAIGDFKPSREQPLPVSGKRPSLPVSIVECRGFPAVLVESIEKELSGAAGIFAVTVSTLETTIAVSRRVATRRGSSVRKSSSFPTRRRSGAALSATDIRRYRAKRTGFPLWAGRETVRTLVIRRRIRGLPRAARLSHAFHLTF